jgi:hypothetical protein
MIRWLEEHVWLANKTNSFIACLSNPSDTLAEVLAPTISELVQTIGDFEEALLAFYLPSETPSDETIAEQKAEIDRLFDELLSNCPQAEAA